MRFLTRVPFVLSLAFLCLTQTATGQRLYDPQRDAEAQAALKIVADLQSGSLFDKQLKNLGSLAKRDMEASLAAARVRMRADINSFTTWEDVNCVVGRVDNRISQVDDSPEITKKLGELAKQIKTANDAFVELQRETECKLKAGFDDIDLEKCPEAKPGVFARFFEQAGDVEDIEESIRLLSKSFAKHKNITDAIDLAKDVIGRLETLYLNYTKRMNAYNQLEGQLMDIRLQLKKVALQSLQLQAQHLKNTLKIRARREVEEADIISMIDDYEEFSEKYGFRFDREAPPPCAPDEIRASGHRALPTMTDENIEMDLRDLVAKVKYAEETLDTQKMALAQLEVQELSKFQVAVNHASRAASSTPGSQQQAELGSAKQQLMERSQAESLKSARVRMESLTAAASAWRQQLSTKVFALHLAAAISARGEIPAKMATLRQNREDHAYSIRQSALMARAYQLTVAGGVKRLALYHQGGIKPSKIAELIHAAATVAIPAVIAND